MTKQKELIPTLPGDILAHERKKKGLTLEKAAAQSRIRLGVLEAIESGETGEIPSVYLRGHIRHYARYLGVDSQQLDQHMEHISGIEPAVRSVFEFKSKRGDADRWLKATSYLVASALIATLAWQFTHEAVRFSQSDSRLVSGTAAPAGPGRSNSPSLQDTNTHLNASIASIELLNLPEEGQAGHGESSLQNGQISPVINKNNDQSVTAIDDSQHLKIVSSGDTWIEILDAAGLHMEMDLLRAGTSREYRGKAPFRVMLGRASAVEVWFDGQHVDLAAHTRGNVAHLTLGDQQAKSVKR